MVDDGSGCMLPLGAVQKTKVGKTSVNVNEFIVCESRSRSSVPIAAGVSSSDSGGGCAADNVNQVRIRYLLRLKMGEEEESDEENGDDY